MKPCTAISEVKSRQAGQTRFEPGYYFQTRLWILFYFFAFFFPVFSLFRSSLLHALGAWPPLLPICGGRCWLTALESQKQKPLFLHASRDFKYQFLFRSPGQLVIHTSLFSLAIIHHPKLCKHQARRLKVWSSIELVTLTIPTYGMGEPTHTLVPCWMPKPLLVFKAPVHRLFCSSHQHMSPW